MLLDLQVTLKPCSTPREIILLVLSFVVFVDIPTAEAISV